MAINLIDAEDVRSGRHGVAKGIRYGKYAEAINSHVPQLKEQIAKHNVIRVRISDIANEMGGEFTKKNATSIYWGLKYVLFDQGIVVGNATHKTGDKLLVMRKRVDGDVLPASLAKNDDDKDVGVDEKKDNDIDPTDISLEDIIGE
jgi:hypothetical protein